MIKFEPKKAQDFRRASGTNYLVSLNIPKLIKFDPKIELIQNYLI